ncbi:MAG: prefoldin subunit alpha [Desulfurococcales archaeon]|nr:prefoldin subunit alpha [Desulfurococcales archaeon]
MAEEKTQVKVEETIKQLQDELRGLISQAEQLRAQIATINGVITDLFAALEVLDYLEREGKGKTILVPIGGGNLIIKAKVEDVQSVIMNIGGTLNVETSIEDAKKAVDSRIKLLEQIRLDLLKKLEEVNRRINEILPRLEESLRQ